MGEAILFGRGIPVLYDPKFANNSWEKIIAYCQRGTVPEEWKVGDQKAMTINGTDYLIDIIGKDHDDYADGSGKAPLTFQMHDCYGTTYEINSSSTNVGGWEGCNMRVSHLPAILSLMPTEVQSAIREVSKLTSAGNKSTAIIASADRLFLLSYVEIKGVAGSTTVSGEGSMYAYYETENSDRKSLNGSASAWWTRSPNSGRADRWVSLGTTGMSASGSPTYTYGVAPAFCF